MAGPSAPLCAGGTWACGRRSRSFWSSDSLEQAPRVPAPAPRAHTWRAGGSQGTSRPAVASVRAARLAPGQRAGPLRQNVWWGHLSVAFIAVPYVLLWMLAGPLVVRAWLALFGTGAPQRCAACAAWLVFGPLFVVALDPLVAVQYPTRQPRSSLLLSFVRLRALLVSMVESPAQAVLQSRVFWFMAGSQYVDVAFPWTLLFSICTSCLSFGLALVDVCERMAQQEVSFLTCVVDMLCVGMGWRAPLLHVLELQTRASYECEGALTDEHCRQIALAARASTVLEHVEFTDGNGLSALGIVALLETFSGPVNSVSSMAVGEWCRFGKQYVLLGFADNSIFDDEFLESLAQHLPSTAQTIQLDFGGNQQFTDQGLLRLAECLPSTARSVRLNFGGSQKFTNWGLAMLAERLPRTTQSVHLDFRDNENFTDRGLELLAKHLPSESQSVHLDFRCNRNFTDGGLERLAEHLPSGARSIHLNFRGNKNFTDRGLARLAERLPSGARSVELDFGCNKKLTDRGLERLADQLPSAAHAVQLNFNYNMNFTDRGLERLAERLPSAAQRVQLDFGCNLNFTDLGLERLAEHLPVGACVVELNFHYNQSFTDRGLDRLSERFPRAAQRVHLNFGGNQNFSARALERLRGRLPTPGDNLEVGGSLDDEMAGSPSPSVRLDFGSDGMSDDEG
ncbi:unnamed protein product [Prorocentrum cordatum]|uniref:Uncharacterized protein n=1 Tax=Prorocentrum cordatum TaxID=2364126 RepID=A0ABN9WHV1_9DINO|nr:unnamed protein product [Polarella glacialis]